MIIYQGNTQQPISDVNIVNLDDRVKIDLPISIGGHRSGMPIKTGPWIIAPPYKVKNAVATANAVQAGVDVAVNAAALNAPNKFVVVSGLTYCVGLVAGRWNGHGFTSAVVAHFNGKYDNANAWQRIANGLGAGGGPIKAVIVMTRDSTKYDVDTYGPGLLDQLIKLGTNAERVLLYWSRRSGTFLLDGSGFIGEERDRGDFPY